MFGRIPLNERIIDKTLQSLAEVDWYPTLLASKLSSNTAQAYHRIIEQRLTQLGIL